MLKKTKKEVLSIPRDRADALNLDFESMRKLGIDWIQQLSGDIWTDYNIHDPGVTILENLCFGLLDLSYRTEFDIADIIFAPRTDNTLGESKEIEQISDNQAFFLPEQVFPTSPITLNDYRKLLLDQCKKIKQKACFKLK